MPETCSNCGSQLQDESYFCPRCGAEPAWTNRDLVHAGISLLLWVGLAVFGLIEGVRGRNWWQAGASVLILTLCVMYLVSQLRRPRYKLVDTGAPEAARQENEQPQ